VHSGVGANNPRQPPFRLGDPVHFASRGPLLEGARRGGPIGSLFLNGQPGSARRALLRLSSLQKTFLYTTTSASQGSTVSSLVLQPFSPRISLLHIAFHGLAVISQATMLSLVTLSLSFLVTFATAQNTAITWLEPGPAAGAFSYAGEVLDACPGTTIIALQCTAAGSDNAYSDICGTDGPVRLHVANLCARSRRLTPSSQ
jgi:hypothetical protein